jgi:hypothetical protein
VQDKQREITLAIWDQDRDLLHLLAPNSCRTV